MPHEQPGVGALLDELGDAAAGQRWDRHQRHTRLRLPGDPLDVVETAQDRQTAGPPQSNVVVEKPDRRQAIVWSAPQRADDRLAGIPRAEDEGP